MLFALDRTLSMHVRPDGTAPPNTAAGRRASKWGLAVAAVETLTATYGDTIRFGLSLFPKNPGGGACVTLAQLAGGTTATNPTCQVGEVLEPPALASASAIAGAIDIDTTELCVSTPIGGGIEVATTELASIHVAGRDQYVVLLTDGQDTCDAAGALAKIQALAAAGVKTFVIGFGATGTGINAKQLDNFACAGRTAVGFPAPCTADASGNYKATSPGTGAALYLAAEDATALSASLGALAGQVCCGCIQ